MTADGQIVGKGDIAAQTAQILANIETALAAAGAGLEHIVKWNVMVVEGQPFGPGYAEFQKVWGDRPNPPTISAAVVAGLAHPDFLVEIDAIAVVPEIDRRLLTMSQPAAYPPRAGSARVRDRPPKPDSGPAW